MTDLSILKYFADYIESQLGIVYTETNYFQLEHRLKDIAAQLGLKDVVELHQKSLLTGFTGSLKSLLLDLATNNETSFFRDVTIFKALSHFIYPEVVKHSNPHQVQIWSAAASTGQEVYSIAMELEGLLKTNPTYPHFKLLATDISDTVLKRCDKGVYSQLEVQRGLPAKSLIEFFDKDGENTWKIKPSLRTQVDFRKLNLLDTWNSHGPFQIVFCRNVLIYQNVENKKKVVDKIYQCLSPKGFLIMGAAESLFGISNDFDQVSIGGAVFYRKK